MMVICLLLRATHSVAVIAIAASFFAHFATVHCVNVTILFVAVCHLFSCPFCTVVAYILYFSPCRVVQH